MRITTATFLLFTLFCTPATAANLVAFEITATVDTVYDPLGLLGGSVLVGDTLTGILQYDLLLVDNEFDVDLGLYFSSLTGNNFINGTNGTIGNFETIDFMDIRVENGYIPGEDSITFIATGDTNPSALAAPNIDYVDLEIVLRDDDGTVFSDDSLPATLDLADFETAQVFFSAEDVSLNFAFDVEASITSITPIPEPSTLLLGALAGVGLLVRRRRA
ncbi:MAG: PEP-CTERM sorting domain-containing protein [Planctomycetes bacterium]|nr:PEP-CTERM sorting domain-containing protein [Planctomycetota bacterium]